MKIKVQFMDDLSNDEKFCVEIDAREHMAAQAIDRYMRVKKQREPILRKCLIGEYPIVAYDTETCEVKHSEKFGDYYDIKGDGWGGAGGFIKDGKTKIVLL